MHWCMPWPLVIACPLTVPACCARWLQLGYTPTIKIVPEGGLSVDQYIAK